MSDRPIEELDAGEAFRQSMKPRADFSSEFGRVPLWCGWVIMEAFLAGIDWARTHDVKASGGAESADEDGAEPADLKIQIRHGEQGLFYATSEQITGLLVAGGTVREVFERLPTAIAELRAVKKLGAAASSGGAESADGAHGQVAKSRTEVRRPNK